MGFASRNYYAEFLALLRAAHYQDVAYGSSPEALSQPVRFVRLDSVKPLYEVAEDHRIAPTALLELNPDVLSTKKPLPAGFLLAVPARNDDFSLVIDSSKSRSRGARKSRTKGGAALQAKADAAASGRHRG